ncbi:MAG TPA: STAS-like domain-containing protein [Thermoanaerobaculia bacterium]|nr:STAS-like domain-containing protein [Thermoanaerobaculia bacterium]
MQNATNIQVPSTLTDRDLIRFYQGWQWFEHPRGPVVLDFRDVNFIMPWAATLFAAWTLWAHEVRGRKIRLEIDEGSSAGQFLQRSGFISLFGHSAKSPQAHDDTRMVPLTRIKASSEIPAFAQMVMKVLAIDDDEIAGAVRYSLIELLRNVVQHSKSKIGGVAMSQYFPRTGLVEIVVADCGIGIRDSLQQKYDEIDNDFKALKFGMQAHVSRTFDASNYQSMQDNAGLGLFFIKSIASFSGGGFSLGTKRVLADVWGAGDGTPFLQFRESKSLGWPGTFAFLKLKRHSIAEFDAVLKTCRELAARARAYPAEQALDFLEEVPEVEGVVVVRVKDFEENVEQAAKVRDKVIIPALADGKPVVLDFSKIPFATQSFVHACVYKVLRDSVKTRSGLSIAGASESTREAIRTVAAYAQLET